MTAKVFRLAIGKAASLPEEAQEQIGREILKRIAALERLRADIEIGIEELDAGYGKELDIETLIKDARAEYARS